MYITIGIVVVIIIIILGIYNSLIKAKKKVEQARSTIDIYLNQRFDLIPNLVECVKGYVKHEKNTLETITEMRAQYIHNQNLKEAEKINHTMNEIIAVSESYPELKASEQFLELQKNLSKMESQLQAARRIYNNEVTEYNTKISVLPNNLFAKVFGMKEEELFQIEESKKENIDVTIEEG